MGVYDMNNGVDVDAARYDRENRMNPPEYPPGQMDYNNQVYGGDMGMGGMGGMGSMSDTSFSSFGDSSAMPINQNGMGDIFSQNLGGGGNVFNSGLNIGQPSMNGQLGMPNMQQSQPKSAEDAFFDGIKAAGKGSYNIFNELINSMKGLTPLFWYKYANKCMLAGAGVSGLGILLVFLGFGAALKVVASGLLMMSINVVWFMMLTDKSKQCTSEYVDENNTNNAMLQPDNSFTSSGMDAFGGDDDFFNNPSSGGFDDYSSDDEGYGDDEDYDDFGEDGGDDDEDWDFDVEDVKGEDGMNPDEALGSLQDIPIGMYTRQYLWDAFIKVLPTMKPSFAAERYIDSDSDAFFEWEASLQEASEVAGCKEDFLPELLELKENLFTIVVTCSRPNGMKVDMVASELARIYAYKDGEFNPGVYAKADTVGQKVIITIFTGVSAMISLKDMMTTDYVQEYMLNSSHYIPVVFGVDPRGKVIVYDMKSLESIIITGMPRSGKSWFVQAILTQMCAFVSPKELQFYVCDPKDKISDFKRFSLPHVKKFVGEDAAIVQTLKYLVKVEAPRRKKIIGDAGYVNIWEYKDRYPDTDIPIIYVIVDEIVTLASRMDKDTNNDFRMLLRELISQLPALGIRAFLIPHMLNNDIIEKKTSDIVECKVSVKGDADHIEKATGSKPKDFPYKLSNTGDMAVRMPKVSPDTMFIHGPVLTDAAVKNEEVFDYMRRVWSKLEPDAVQDSVAVAAEEDAETKELLKKLADDSEDIELFDNPSESSGYDGAVDDFLKNLL